MQKFVASAGLKTFLALVPEVRAKDELEALLEAQMDSAAPASQAAEALTNFLIAEGAAFCKLAQVSAEQPGVVDPVTRDALRAVQDSCKAAPFEDIKSVLEDCIATELSSSDFSLKDLDPKPLGVGSVAQVHSCGSNVVKIALLENLKTMEEQAIYLPKMASWAVLKNTPLANVAKFIEGALRGWRREFDMKETEGRCLLAFSDWLKQNPGQVRGLRLPVFKAACSRVLVMSRESGRPFKKLSEQEQQKCLSTVLELASKSLFAIGMVHCDPHPGNILLNDDREVVLLDFGAVSEFPTDKVEQLRILFSRLPHYITGMAFETEIADAMRHLGFTTMKNTDKGLAMLASHAFDSRLPAPLEMMKRGEYGDKNDPPVQSFPPEMTAFLRFRSVLGGLLAGLGYTGENTPEDLSLVAQFSKATGVALVMPSSAAPSASTTTRSPLASPLLSKRESDSHNHDVSVVGAAQVANRCVFATCSLAAVFLFLFVVLVGCFIASHSL